MPLGDSKHSLIVQGPLIYSREMNNLTYFPLLLKNKSFKRLLSTVSKDEEELVKSNSTGFLRFRMEIEPLKLDKTFWVYDRAFKKKKKFMATPTAHGSSQPGGWIWATDTTYATGVVTPDPLTHCVGLEIKPMPSKRPKLLQSDLAPQRELLHFFPRK